MRWDGRNIQQQFSAAVHVYSYSYDKVYGEGQVAQGID